MENQSKEYVTNSLFTNIGYFKSSNKINATDFGVPQNSGRVF